MGFRVSSKINLEFTEDSLVEISCLRLEALKMSGLVLSIVGFRNKRQQIGCWVFLEYFFECLYKSSIALYAEDSGKVGTCAVMVGVSEVSRGAER